METKIKDEKEKIDCAGKYRFIVQQKKNKLFHKHSKKEQMKPKK